MKVRFSFCCILFWLHAFTGNAQISLFQGDARSRGMANIRSVFAGSWSCLNNPAGLAALTGASFGLSYENYFQLPELGLASFSCGIPTKSGNFGLGIQSFGYSGLRQNQASLAYGRYFGKRLSTGIGLHWLTINQPAGYTDLFAIVPSLGIRLIPFENIVIGMSVMNPARQNYRPSRYKTIPAGILAGMGYQLGDEVWICIETEKRSGQQARYSAGIEVALQKIIRFRFGIAPSGDPAYSFGVGYHYKKLSVDASFMHYSVPGFSTAFGLTRTI